MDIEIEPYDELLWPININHGFSMNTVWSEGHFVDCGRGEPVVHEEFDEDHLREEKEAFPLELDIFKEEEEEIEERSYIRENADDELIDLKPEKLELGDCLSIQWEPDQITIDLEAAVKNDHTYAGRTHNQVDRGRVYDACSEAEPVVVLEKEDFFDRNFVCRLCNAIFPSSDSLGRHGAVHMRKPTATPSTTTLRRKDLAFKCKDCSFKTRDSAKLKRHQLIRSVKHAFRCDRCHYSCPIRSTLALHKMSHTGERPFACDRCDYRATSNRRLGLHKDTHVDKKCELCDYVCSLKRELYRHMQLKHPTEKRFECDRCGIKMASANALKLHRRTHAKPVRKIKTSKVDKRVFRCSICGLNVVGLFSMKKHKILHYLKPRKDSAAGETLQFDTDKPDNAGEVKPSEINSKRHPILHYLKSKKYRDRPRAPDGSKLFACDICGLTFNHRYELNSHKNIHKRVVFKCQICEFSTKSLCVFKKHENKHAKTAKRYMCELCGFRTSFINSFDKHTILHTSNQTFKCDFGQCNFVAFHSYMLRIHKMQHTGENPLRCEICDFKSTTPSGLDKHKRTHTQYACNKCNFKSYSVMSLNTHKLSHINEELHFCTQCEFKTSDYEHLKTHKIVHIKFERYKCSHCDFESPYLHLLKVHRKMIHPFTLKARCDQCGYIAVNLTQLILHKKTHAQEKAFVCQMCDATFATSFSLSLHTTTHPREGPWKCDRCKYSSAFRALLIVHKKTHTA